MSNEGLAGVASDAGWPEAGPRATPRSRAWKAVRALFLLAALLAAGWLLVSRRSEVGAALTEVSPAAFMLSVAAAVGGYFFPMLVWRRLLADLGSPLHVGPAARVFFFSQMGKYVPGSIWTVVAQIDLGRELKVPPSRSGAAALLSLAFGLLGALLTALVTLPFARPRIVGDYWWVLLCIPFLLLVLHPRCIAAWTGALSRLTGRGGGSVTVGYRALLVGLGWTAASWSLLGLHLFLLVPDASSDGMSAFALCAGVFALAWGAGFLAFFAPAGAGIREAVLVVGLATYVPAGGALLVALLSRVVATLADLVLFAGAFLLARLRRKVAS